MGGHGFGSARLRGISTSDFSRIGGTTRQAPALRVDRRLASRVRTARQARGPLAAAADGPRRDRAAIPFELLLACPALARAAAVHGSPNVGSNNCTGSSGVTFPPHMEKLFKGGGEEGSVPGAKRLLDQIDQGEFELPLMSREICCESTATLR